MPPDGRNEDQANDQDSTTITTSCRLDLPLRTSTTQALAPSLLSPFSPSNAGMLGYSHVRSEVPVMPVARGPEFEHRALRAMETTMHLAQIVRMSPMPVAREKESDEVTVVAKGKVDEGDGTGEGQKGKDEEEADEWDQVNSEDVTERWKSVMFKRGLETLNEEYLYDSRRIVDARMNRHFQLGGDAGAVIAPGPGKHSILGCLSDSDCFTIPRHLAVYRGTCYCGELVRGKHEINQERN
ncbi:hypothetical protein KCU77_g5006, partial [Aureobasidium melanogenum]